MEVMAYREVYILSDGPRLGPGRTLLNPKPWSHTTKGIPE
jgi:hypothetical protein